VGGSGSGQGKAEPPTVPDVWVARRRRDIAYHAVPVADVFTVCGRAARASGQRLPLAEAEAFGAVPCDRCYTESEG
jgi:hypothetical protein